MRMPTDLMLFSLMGSVLLSACVEEREPLEAAEATSETAAALDGTLVTSICEPARATKLDQAVQLLSGRVLTPAFRACFQSAFMTYERRGRLAEDLVNALASRPTTIRCVAPGHCGPGQVACASVPPPGSTYIESMFIEIDYLDAATNLDLAKTIAQQATRTLGHDYPASQSGLGYLWSTPVQTASCLGHQTAEGRTRWDVYGDNETAPVGGSGGLPFVARCPAGQRVTGITTDASTHINRLQLSCNGTPLAAIGSFQDSTDTETHTCAAGSSLIGSSTSSDSMVRGMTSYCAADADLIANVAHPSIQSHWHRGGWQGTTAERVCPVGMAVIGATGRAGARIDQLRWLCGDRDGAVLPNPTVPGLRGTTAGVAQYEHCTGFGALRGLYGHAGAEVNMLAGECMSTHRPGGVLALNPSGRHGLEPNGARVNTAFEQPCPANTAMIGIQVRSGGRLDAIGAICASPADWAANIPTAQYYTAMAGGPGGFASELRCPSRSFVTGLRTWAQATPELGGITSIHGVEPYCRPLEP